MRLQKYIAHSGITSRRKAEDLIKQGRVRVNETIRTDMGIDINPKTDKIFIDEKLIKIESKSIYIMLNKPIGYVTTFSDQFNRPTVMDLVNEISERIYPVGRLDYDTSGLLLLTNDGDLTYKLTHPKHEFKKVYMAKVKGKPLKETIIKLETGIKIDGQITAPARFRIIKQERNCTMLEISIHEGRNRQIRKMLESVGHPVKTLTRIAMGKIHLKDLQRGKWRNLTPNEISYLKSL